MLLADLVIEECAQDPVMVRQLRVASSSDSEFACISSDPVREFLARNHNSTLDMARWVYKLQVRDALLGKGLDKESHQVTHKVSVATQSPEINDSGRSRQVEPPDESSDH